MPMYEFLNEKTDDICEFHFEMRKVPSIGDTIERGGAIWTRIAGGWQVSAGVTTIVNQYPYISHRHGRWAKGVRKHTKEGKPIISSRREEKEFMDRHDLVRD